MRFQTLFLVTLCLVGHGYAEKKDCNSRFNEEALINVNNIAKELNITPCIAGDVYDYINQDFKQIKGECSTSCANAAKEKFSKINQTTVDELLNICEGKCFIENMDTNEKKEDEDDSINLEKRAPKCDPIKNGKVEIVKKNYKFGYNKYKDSGKVKTALSQANGCGPKKAVFGIDNETMKKIPLLLDGTFEAACNSHDVCYSCKKGKSNCDKKFKSNMLTICNKKYPKSSHPVKYAGCATQATIFYGAVSVGGKNAYNAKPVNSSTSCAACGVTTVKNALVNTPFYR